MKKAVAILEPLMDAERLEKKSKGQGLVLLATVKGDVHDIGKNIVSVVLACNGYEVIDLGVMVNCQQIINIAKEKKVDLIGLSGLITPSLEEMAFNLQEFERAGLSTPVLIGGATTSKVHTAVKLDPNYRFPVVHVPDASQVVEHCQKLLHSSEVAKIFSGYKDEAEKLRKDFETRKKEDRSLLSVESARELAPKFDWNKNELATPSQQGVLELSVDVKTLMNYIDWSPFFWTWGLKGVYPQILKHAKYGTEAQKLFDDASRILNEDVKTGWIKPKAVIGIFRADRENETVQVYDQKNTPTGSFTFLRQRHPSVMNNNVSLCLADFIAPKNSGLTDYMGCFAVTAGAEIEAKARTFEQQGDDYNSILIKAVGDRLAEAAAEWAHKMARDIFGYGKNEDLGIQEMILEKYRGIRPAPGYPACPRHEDKLTIWKLLDVERRTGIKLTENLAMTPASSVSGLYFNHPGAKYFHVGPQE